METNYIRPDYNACIPQVENVIDIDKKFTFSKFITLCFALEKLKQIVLKKQNKKFFYLLQNSLLLTPNTPSSVQTAIVFMTVYDNFYVYFPADDVIKESLKKIQPFKSKFGMDTNKLFEDMFASYKEPGFTSRFSKPVSITAIVDESTFLNTKRNSFLSNNKEIILFSLLVVSVIGLLDYYAKNNFVYEFQWFVEEKKTMTEKITKPKKVSKNIQELTNQEFLIYVFDKIRKGQCLSEEELSYLLLLLKHGIWSMLKMLRNGVISIYLIALFIKILMVLIDYFKLLNLILLI
jgi:hypothetical protein